MKVCLFDIDGTLIASGGAGKAAMEAAMASAFGITEIRASVTYSGRTDRAIGLDLIRLHDLEETPHTWQRLLAAYLHHLPACLANHRGWILPGIAALLEHLRAQDQVVLGLLTGNVRDGARLKLGHYQLYDYFAFGGFGDLHLDRDDVAREALAAVHQHCNGTACLEQVWVIGDTPLDIRCARAIGARVAAVATGLHPLGELAAEKPDLLLPDFSDPTHFLTALV
jgi:phosphoglycolate phosphatase-like HAD superfamily hydrolase